MPAERVTAWAVVLIVAVFLALVIVNVRWGKDEDGAAPGEMGPRLSHVQVAEDAPPEEVGPEAVLGLQVLSELMEGRIRLLTGGQTNERRATAIQLAYMVGRPQEQGDLIRISEQRRHAV